MAASQKGKNNLHTHAPCKCHNLQWSQQLNSNTCHQTRQKAAAAASTTQPASSLLGRSKKQGEKATLTCTTHHRCISLTEVTLHRGGSPYKGSRQASLPFTPPNCVLARKHGPNACREHCTAWRAHACSMNMQGHGMAINVVSRRDRQQHKRACMQTLDRLSLSLPTNQRGQQDSQRDRNSLQLCSYTAQAAPCHRRSVWW